jgi:hypothetical protein
MLLGDAGLETKVETGIRPSLRGPADDVREQAVDALHKLFHDPARADRSGALRSGAIGTEASGNRNSYPRRGAPGARVVSVESDSLAAPRPSSFLR